MAPTIGTRDTEHELATLRCLVAQQLASIERHERGAPEHRAADLLLRRLLRHEEDLRRTRRAAVAPSR